MKRAAATLLMVSVVAAFILSDRWLPHLSLWLPSWSTESPYLGYVEGETTLVSPPVAGRLVSRTAQRGATVANGTVLFRLDTAAAEADVARAEASVAEATAQFENLKTGKRNIEQEIVRAQRREAEAALRLAERDLARATQLVSQRAVSQQQFDHDKSQVEQLRAKIEQLKAEEEAGELGGRTQELEAAEAKVREAEASLAQAKVRLRDLAPVAPVDALVDDTFFDVGEWVGAGQPVVSLLAADQVKLRFFVPEEDVALARPGAIVAFSCDGCPARQRATITYVAPRAEYTPPVIYSQSAQKKLVFLVEAKPVAGDQALRPGLPVEVEPLKEVVP